MTTTRFLGVGYRESFTEHMDRLARDGVPNLDNVSDGTVDGPDECTCDAIPGDHTEDQCAGICVRCGYQPDDIRQIVGGLCKDCDHQDDYVGGLAPRLMGHHR